jgi:hypothetical protein
MKSARQRAAGLLCLVALFVFSCTYPTYVETPAAEEESPTPPSPAAPTYEPEPYALYMVDCKGAIVIENHCENWLSGGWPSIDAYYAEKLAIYRADCESGTWGDNRPWTLYAGVHYVEPTS